MNTENDKLKFALRQTLWMARRYADGRSTFAPSDFNEVVHMLDDMGLGELMPGDDAGRKRFASDGMLGEYNPETRQFDKESPRYSLFEKALRLKGPLSTRECSICGYMMSYLVQDDRICFDSGCDCVTWSNVQPVSSDAVEELFQNNYYNINEFCGGVDA